VKLLFITQKIDKEDDILGVYHEWAKRLAERVAELNVICLYKGDVDLPLNARVWSLGKEKGLSKLAYLLNFYGYIFRLRNSCDLVFVHMNPSYILLGWFWWKLWGKKIAYWNASYKISALMKLGLFLADVGVTSVPEAFDVKSKKIVAIGQGIDTSCFKRDETVRREISSILFLGRVSPVKNLEVLISAVNILHSRGIAVTLNIVGLPAKGGEKYYGDIRRKALGLEEQDVVKFSGAVPHHQTPQIYNSHKIFVNLTESGSFDKSILEAMACQTLVLVSNKIYERIFPDNLKGLLMFKEKNAADLASKLERLLELSSLEAENIGAKLREIVVKDHNLDSLSSKLVSVFSYLL
jgi:glycosyltransferase involved in cell wall biosynthesis